METDAAEFGCGVWCGVARLTLQPISNDFPFVLFLCVVVLLPRLQLSLFLSPRTSIVTIHIYITFLQCILLSDV